MSIRRMSLGAGYRYLMSSVARLDAGGAASGLTAYYAANGTPPGRFLGAGLAGLDNGHGVAPGTLVTEEGLWRMLGMLQDPVTGQPLGAAPLTRRAAYVDNAGRVHPVSLPVAGFDLTFSVPKSVSVAWALADDVTRARLYAAHRRALEAVIGYGEKAVFATRVGRGGAIQQDVRGVVAAGFDHWDSRAHDPQLHTHVVVLNRVQAVSDGVWRTLDSKALHRAAVAMSELYNGVLADEITAEFGWAWVPEGRRRSPEPKWEIAGVPADLRDHFSQRSSAIEVAKDALVEGFVAAYGRPPTGPEVIKLRQQATLATRGDKDVRPLRDLITVWRERARPWVGDHPEQWVAALAEGSTSIEPRLLTAAEVDEETLRGAAAAALVKVADKRATFNRSNLLAQVLRELHGVRFAAPADRITVAEKTTTYATGQAVRLTPTLPEPETEHGLRVERTTRLRPRDCELFATRELLDAEARLLQGAASTTAPVATPQPTTGLSAEQAAAVSAVIGSGRRIDLIVGAAGTGKSTTMAAVRAAWEAAHGRGSVIGLAPSAAAAQVLADAVGVPAENTAKWITEHAKTSERAAVLDRLAARLAGAYPSPQTRALQSEYAATRADLARWSLGPGQLVIIDEASMVATRDLDHLATAAGDAGAKVLLVGDWAQLSPVQAGGAFTLLADARPDAPHLHDVRRFRHEWERAATLRLRAGDPAVADMYVEHGRVVAGEREDVLDLLFDAWRTDTRAGRTCLMLAADADTVIDLNTRARAYRVAAGDIPSGGVRLGDGTVGGVGDLVVTRLNQRALVTGRGWVKNGDAWTIQAINPDGSMRLTRTGGGGAVATLPAAYVAEHLELGYATTAHRAQGRTVDTAHAYINTATIREPLYVMATRGRESNRLYVDTAADPSTASDPVNDNSDLEPVTVLQSAIATSGADVSATDVLRTERGVSRNPDRETVAAHRERAVDARQI